MTAYRIVAEQSVNTDVEAAFDWYQAEQPGLGLDFLQELRATYDRILQGPLKYQLLKSGIRRALTRRFPQAVYFAVEGEVIVVVAILHASRNPAEWQRRRS